MSDRQPLYGNKLVSAIERSKSSHNASIKQSKLNKRVWVESLLLLLFIVEEMSNPKSVSSFSFFNLFFFD